MFTFSDQILVGRSWDCDHWQPLGFQSVKCVLSQSSAFLVIVHKAKLCALDVVLFQFYPLTFDEVVCVYNLKHGAKKPQHALLRLVHFSSTSCVFVCAYAERVCLCVHTCDETLPVLLTEIKFQRIKNTPDNLVA